jgi:hypothetical protein
LFVLSFDFSGLEVVDNKAEDEDDPVSVRRDSGNGENGVFKAEEDEDTDEEDVRPLSLGEEVTLDEEVSAECRLLRNDRVFCA